MQTLEDKDFLKDFFSIIDHRIKVIRNFLS